MHCLIVEDDTNCLFIATKIISERMGYNVLTATNAEHALELCSVNTPELILLDWNLPEMSGIDFLLEMRALGKHHLTSVVMCTAKADKQDVHAAITAGASGYIVKPFTEEMLLKQLSILGFKPIKKSAWYYVKKSDGDILQSHTGS